VADVKIIKVDYLARVEGEGALTIRIRDGQVEDVKLEIFEPPRFFEGFLRERSFREAPDITARICGICPVAYQMSACHAMEDALGVTLPPDLRRLRRLLYCGEWVESHALHMFMLHAPDFLGFQDAIAMSAEHGDWVKRGLAIKKAGNAIVNVLGGREIHPINVRAGGFFRLPTRAEMGGLATFDFPEFERDYEMVGLRHPDEYPFCEGRIVSNKGLDIDLHDYEKHFEELHVEHSTALHSVLRGTDSYLVGPLARINLCFDKLGDTARAAADAIGFAPPCTNPFKSLLARGIELVQVLAEAQQIVDEYRVPSVSHVEVEPRASSGCGCTEAPRGMLFHRYRLDDEGLIEEAKIVPPTSQNQGTIEQDLRELAPELAKMPLEDATWRAEQAVRNYDPCISCSTHFLKLRFEET